MSAPDNMPQGRLRAALVLPYVLGQASTGTDQIGMQFRLLDEPWKGWTLPWYGTFSEAAFPMTYEALRACGWRGEFIKSLKSDLVDGAEVSLVVEPEEYDGKWRSRIKFVNPPTSIRMHRTFTPEQRTALAVGIQDMIDQGLHEREKRKAAAGSTSTPGRGGSNDDDDIPF
jgi:hypothetical protein